MSPSHEKNISSRREFLASMGATAVLTGLGTVATKGLAAPKPDPPLTHLSATKLADLIASKAVSAEEVAEAYLKRIEEVNPKLNAIVQLDAERVRAEARKADKDLAKGVVRGPLHGVPFTIKDQLLTRGIITTNGCPELRSYVPEQDATVVKRLKDAGGILLGKTNVPEMCYLGITDNLVYGRTNNPYDVTRTPGGSSGGEAAIIAAGGSPLGIGTDIGNSIRQPSHYCGIAGIKPTGNRVPETGMLGAFTPSVADWNAIGPVARCVEDLELGLRVISGPDGKDYNTVPAPLRLVSRVQLDRLRVAYYTDDDGPTEPTAETKKTVERAAQELNAMGVAVAEDRPPGLSEVASLWRDLLIPEWGATARYWMQEYARIGGTNVVGPRFFVSEVGLKWLDYWAENGEWTSERRFQLEMKLHEFRAKTLAFMQNYDVLLSPVLNGPAEPHSVEQELLDMPLNELWTESDGDFCQAHNLTGWPAAVVRAGTSSEGLPIGVQIAAKPWREDIVLAVAKVIDEKCGGWQPPPL